MSPHAATTAATPLLVSPVPVKPCCAPAVSTSVLGTPRGGDGISKCPRGLRGLKSLFEGKRKIFFKKTEKATAWGSQHHPGVLNVTLRYLVSSWGGWSHSEVLGVTLKLSVSPQGGRCHLGVVGDTLRHFMLLRGTRCHSGVLGVTLGILVSLRGDHCHFAALSVTLRCLVSPQGAQGGAGMSPGWIWRSPSASRTPMARCSRVTPRRRRRGPPQAAAGP